MLTKPGVTSIIIGAKKMDQLIDNIECTGLKLTDKELGKLEEVSALVQEYPAWMVNRQMTGRYPE
jgi:aryl-alcohol dehydrogenase-like predicted oxidoreductase